MFHFSMIAMKCDLFGGMNISRLLFGRAFNSWEHQGCCGIFRNERMAESMTAKAMYRGKNDRDQKRNGKRKNSPARERAEQAICYRGVAGMLVWPSILTNRREPNSNARWIALIMRKCIFQRDIFVHNEIPLVMTCWAHFQNVSQY